MLMELSCLGNPVLWIAVCISAAAAGFVQSVTGFGAAVVLVLVLSRFLEIKLTSTLVLVICILLSGRMLWRYRKEIPMKTALAPTLIFSAVGFFTVFFLKNIQLRTLTILFGGFLVALGVFYLVKGDRVLPKPGKPLAWCWSIFSGILGGLFSTGGPTMALYFLAVTDSAAAYIAALQFLFFVSNVVTLISRVFNGFFYTSMLPFAAAGFVFSLLGEYFGTRFRKKMNRSVAQKIAYAAVTVSGLVSILQQVV